MYILPNVNLLYLSMDCCQFLDKIIEKTFEAKKVHFDLN